MRHGRASEGAHWCGSESKRKPDVEDEVNGTAKIVRVSEKW